MACLLAVTWLAGGITVEARTTDNWVTWFGWDRAERGFAVAPYADGGVVAAGLEHRDGYDPAWLVRIDHGGSLLWTLMLMPEEIAVTKPVGLHALGDGDMILALQSQSFLWFVRIGAMGEVRWQRRFELPARLSAFALLDSDTLGIALVREGETGCHVLTLMANGDILASAYMPGVAAQVDRILPDAGGRILAAGRPRGGATWLASIDLSSRAIAWQREIDLSVQLTGVARDGDGGLMLCGRGSPGFETNVVGLDSVGLPSWHVIAEWGDRDFGTVTCEALREGGMVVATDDSTLADDAITWFAVGASGTLQWSWELPAERDEMRIEDLKVTDDGDIVMIGDADIPGVEAADKGMVIRAKGDGSLESACVYPGVVELVEQPPLASEAGTVTLETSTHTLVDGDLMFEFMPINSDFLCCPFGAVPDEVAPPGSGPDARLHWTDKRTIAWEPLDRFEACGFSVCSGDLPYDRDEPGRCSATIRVENSLREGGADQWDERAYFYLVTAVNDRHRGSFGTDSFGNERSGFILP